MAYIYPSFTNEVALEVFAELEAKTRGGTVPTPFPNSRHDNRANFPSLGGVAIVPPSRLRELREKMISEIESSRTTNKQAWNRRFDMTVGRILSEHFNEDGIAQASNPQIWPYLTMVALSDLAVRRFPPDKYGSLPKSRFLGGRRNVFFSRYIRAATLGDLLDDPDISIFEDDLVGLFERKLSSDHELARAISDQISQIPQGPQRRETVRQGLRAINYELRVTDLGSLSHGSRDSFLKEIFR